MEALRYLGKIPGILKQAVVHTIGQSATGDKWDLRTEVTIHFIRAILTPPAGTATRRNIDDTQALTTRDSAVKGNLWISKVPIPAPAGDNTLVDLVCRAVDDLAEPGAIYTRPPLVDISAEWTGFRGGVSKWEQQPAGASETDKYASLMKEVSSKTTILYFHGGAYTFLDPITHRGTCSRLAGLTRGRVLSVRYRLAPQGPFPYALLDALLAYMYLLYPPPGALHAPEEASHVVFAGDSAGGNLCLSLTALLLHLHRQPNTPKTIPWFGRQVPLPPLPAGVGTSSPWCDLTSSSPSTRNKINAQYDYLNLDLQLNHNNRYKPSPSWPSTPPRADLVVDATMLCHPLLSLTALPASAWANSPPMYVAQGQELLADEGKVVTQRIAAANNPSTTPVIWEGYEAMPHCFGLILTHLPASTRNFEAWADFFNAVVEKGPAGVQSRGTWIEAKTLKETPVDLATLDPRSDEEVLAAMHKCRDAAQARFQAWLKERGAAA